MRMITRKVMRTLISIGMHVPSFGKIRPSSSLIKCRLRRAGWAESYCVAAARGFAGLQGCGEMVSMARALPGHCWRLSGGPDRADRNRILSTRTPGRAQLAQRTRENFRMRSTTIIAAVVLLLTAEAIPGAAD